VVRLSLPAAHVVVAGLGPLEKRTRAALAYVELEGFVAAEGRERPEQEEQGPGVKQSRRSER
jgi:hypothetical protein